MIKRTFVVTDNFTLNFHIVNAVSNHEATMKLYEKHKEEDMFPEEGIFETYEKYVRNNRPRAELITSDIHTITIYS